MRRVRVCLIGLDGVGINNLNVMQSSLPLNHISTVTGRGLISSFVSIPPYTPCAWTSIFTGVFPWRHGILGSTRWKKRLSSFYSAIDVKVPRLPEIFTLNGLKSITVNIVPSYPPNAWLIKDDILVYDETSPRRFIVPSKLIKYLRYIKYPSEVGDLSSGNGKDARVFIDIAYERQKSLMEMIDEEDPDSFIYVIPETDTLLHKVPPLVVRKHKIYQELLEIVDEFLGYCFNKFDVIVVTSDHGFSLYQEALNMSRLLSCLEDTSTSLLRGLLMKLLFSNKLFGLFQSSLLTSFTLYNTYYELRRLLRRISERSGKKGKDARLHMKHKVFYDMVDAADAMILYFSVKDKAILFCNLINRVFGNLVKEVIFLGEIDEELYAIYVVPQEKFYLNFDRIYAKIPSSIINFARVSHGQYGIFVLYDSKKCSRKMVVSGENVDITPTLLACLDLPVPSYADGKPLIPPTNETKTVNYITKWKIARKLHKIDVGYER